MPPANPSSAGRSLFDALPPAQRDQVEQDVALFRAQAEALASGDFKAADRARRDLARRGWNILRIGGRR